MAPATIDPSHRDYVRIFDTTLRDGEQSPGASMTLEEKLQVAELLEAMGVDIIEAGFPIASNGDFEAVSEIAKALRWGDHRRAGTRHQCRYRPGRRGGETRQARAHPHLRVHLADPSGASDAQERGRGGRDRALHRGAGPQPDRRCGMVGDGRDPHADRFPLPLRRRGDQAGATTINLPDTVGYATPDEYKKMFEDIRARVPDADKAIFSVHCHDDLGMAVANSLAGVAGGARQVECTINGLGERAGNAALEEIVMAIRTRGDALPYASAVDPTFLTAPPNWWRRFPVFRSVQQGHRRQERLRP
jgi:2-isopropylmalate synthase